MSIDSFKASVQGFAKPTLFNVSIPARIGPDLTLLCKAAQLPASTLGVIEVPYQGRKIKIAGDRTYAEWTITIINDETMAIRTALEAWSNEINDPVVNIGTNINSYKADGRVSQLNHSLIPISTYNIVGLFPMEISAIELGSDSNDSLEEYTVTLAYDYFLKI